MNIKKIGGNILIVLGAFACFAGIVNIEDLWSMPDHYSTKIALELQGTTKGELWFKTIFISVVGVALLISGFFIKKTKKENI